MPVKQALYPCKRHVSFETTQVLRCGGSVLDVDEVSLGTCARQTWTTQCSYLPFLLRDSMPVSHPKFATSGYQGVNGESGRRFDLKMNR